MSITAPDKLLSWFGAFDHVVVAYSGGVDSSLVLAAATRALGAAAVHAVTARSAAVPSGAAEAAIELSDRLAVKHTIVDTDELSSPGYRANSGARCYFCKSTLLDAITAITTSTVTGPGSVVVTGTNADDLSEGWRPGIRAAAERGVRTPLADVGMGKQAVRELSRRWDLPTWSQPASPCLSSRIAYGVPISVQRLTRIDQAERSVRQELVAQGVNVYNLRVRDLGSTVRIDVDADQVAAVEALPRIQAVIAEAGFDVDSVGSVTVAAFRSGALNEVLPAELRFA